MKENDFAHRLRARIKNDPNLNEAKLAIMAGLDNSTVRGILTGKSKNPRLDTMEKICSALGTTVDEFMSVGSTAEEREIARLVSLLPDKLRLQLLGYAQGLAAGQTGPRELKEDAE